MGTLSNLDDEPSGRRPEVFSRSRQLLRMSVTLTEEVIQRIAHQCSFAEMVKNPASYQVFPGNDNIRFLRKGEIGDWKNHFTSDMNEQVETEFVAKLKEYGLEFDYC